MMSAIVGTKRLMITYKEGWDRKRRRLEKQRIDWSDLLPEIVECIIGRLDWADQIRMRAVCKSWSVCNRHIPTTMDRVPWAITRFYWWGTETGNWERVFRLIDPFSREYIVGGKECPIFLDAKPCASAYGWLLFKVLEETKTSLYLYSPFTSEVIKLPEIDEPVKFLGATFTLDATSPKSIIFLCHVDNDNHKVCVKLCLAGDYSWVEFEFDHGFDDEINEAVCTAYANGVFCCVFSRGQLGAFDLELEEWSILADSLPQNHPYFHDTKLCVWFRSLLWILTDINPDSWPLFKFDFSEMHWVYENSLNNRALFIGSTSFSAPSEGEISGLSNTIFHSDWKQHPVTCYGRTSSPTPSGSGSTVYRECVEAAAKRAMDWIELPLGGIWRANELINATWIREPRKD